AVLGGPAAASLPVRGLGCGREESHAVAPDPRDQVVAVGQQAANDVTGSIVGVGHEVAGFLDTQRVEQQDHLVQERSVVAVGKDRAFVDAASQRQGEYAGYGLGEHGDRLAGVGEDVLRFVV